MPRRTQEDSSVLKELKETIAKQSGEIKSLKGQLKQAAPSSPSAHSHHGAGPSDEDVSSYLTQPFYLVALTRVSWLGIFLASLSFTAIIMNGFEHTLERQIELAYFVPLLAGHGGNTGGQSVGTVLAAFSSKSITVKDAPRVIWKESLSGILAGTILSFLCAPIVHLAMGISLHVTIVIFFTLPWVSTIASTLGAIIPFACVAMGLDPNVIAAPAMTSFVDVLGLMSYFLIAQKVFAVYGVEL